MMRVCTLAATVAISVLVTGFSDHHNIPSALARHVSAKRLSDPLAAQTSTLPSTGVALELRQAPGLVPDPAPPAGVVAPPVPVPAAAPPAPLPDQPAALPPAIAPPAKDPAIIPAPAPPAAIPQANPAVPPAPPAAVFVSPSPATPATPTAPLPPQVTSDDFVTVQWIETHIGTLRTWVPNTYTFHFMAMSQAPLPGVGSIGMGTLSGKPGQTQTIYMVTGAASTPAVGAKKAVIAAVAAGAAGLVV